MKLEPGPAAITEAQTLGKYFCALIDNPAWIRRRVETVKFVDMQRVERRVTLDIDMDRVQAHARDAGLILPSTKKLPVPLTLLQKNLLLDIDVRDAAGSSLAIATSHEDSRAAHAMMLYRIKSARPELELPDVVIRKLYSVAKEMPSLEDHATLTAGDGIRTVAAWRLDDGAHDPSDSDRTIWRDLFTIDPVLATVADFTHLFMPTIYLSHEEGLTLVKYRYVEQEMIMPRREWAERLGLSPSITLIEAPAAGRAEREHLRVLAPEGASIIDMTLGRVGDSDPAPRPGQVFQRRVALERGVIYSSGLERGKYVAFADIAPNASEFTLPALAATLLSSALLLAGAWYQQSVSVLSDAQSTIALLLLAPSTVAAFLTRRGEHQLLGRILAWPRALVGLTTLASLLAAVSIVVLQQKPTREDVPSPVTADLVIGTWWFAGSYCLAVTMLLSAVAIGTYLRMRGVDDGRHSWRVDVQDLKM